MQDLQKNGFVRLPTILKVIPVSKSTWWAAVKSGRFPKSVKLGTHTTAWRAEDIWKLIEELGQKSEFKNTLCQSMKVSQLGKEFIKEWEGYRETTYLDGAHYPTIGYGHLLSPHEKFTVITKDQAEQLFDEDIKEVEEGLNKLIKIPLSQYQFDSVASLAFNWGLGRIAKSEGLEALNKGDFIQALAEFQEVDNIKGVESKGLHSRRLAEAKLFSGVIA